MIEPQIFANQMGLLGDRIGRPLHAATLREYYRHLNASLTTQQFVAATTLLFHRKSAEFRNWPSPAEIIELIAPVATPALCAAEMFERVFAITNDPRVVPSEKRRRVQQLGPTAVRAFVAAGELREFANVLEADVTWLRRRFVEAYEYACAHADAEREATLALNDADARVQQLVAQVSDARARPDAPKRALAGGG